MPEELEKQVILNSNRLRTFEDARLEVVTYVEAKVGLRIRDSKPSDTSISWTIRFPMDVWMQSTLCRPSKGKGSSQVQEVGCFKCGACTFSTRLQCTQRHRQAIVWQR